MLKRLAAAGLIAVLAAGATAEAQRRFGRGFGRSGEYGVPPRFPTSADLDGRYHFCRLMYQQVRRQERGMGWGTDYPYADINFSIRLSELTKTSVAFSKGAPTHLVVRPTDPDLFTCPIVIASDPGSAGFTPEDAAGLRDYLLKGGFLWVDDFWGPWALEAFADEIDKALPRAEYPIRDLPPEHPIYRALYPVDHVPQVPSIQFWRGSGGETSEMGESSARAHMAAISDARGRVMVLLTHNTDISDSWEREGEDPQFFYNFSPQGYALGINAVLYAMSH